MIKQKGMNCLNTDFEIKYVWSMIKESTYNLSQATHHNCACGFVLQTLANFKIIKGALHP